MANGKLYRSGGKEFVATVNYKLLDESPANWWGDLTLTEYMRISEGDGYILVLEDNRSGKCSLKKRVNRAVSGVPPLYHYRFKGRGPLK